MKKLIAVLSICAVTVLSIVGCTTTKQGEISGKIAYKVYEQIEKKTDAETVAKIKDLWLKIDGVETFEELPEIWKSVTADLDVLITEKVKNEVIASILKKLRKDLDDKIAAAISKELDKQEAQEFLIAFRESIRKAIIKSADA